MKCINKNEQPSCASMLLMFVLWIIGGSLLLFDRKMLRNFRKDGHNWKKKKDGKTVQEAHEKLKVSYFHFKKWISLLSLKLYGWPCCLSLFENYLDHHIVSLYPFSRWAMRKWSMYTMHGTRMIHTSIADATGYLTGLCSLMLTLQQKKSFMF